MSPTTTTSERLEQRLEWARKHMGVPRDASLAEIRAQFFRVLEEENFVPNETVADAFRTVRWDAEGVFDDEDPPEFITSEERELLEATEAFAAKMLSFPVAQRRQQWVSLRYRAEHSLRVQTRLASLAPGLDIDATTVDSSGRDMRMETLAHYAMELFPLRPVARAARRNALLQTLLQDDIKPWRKAAKTLKVRHPQIATLAPEFIDQVAKWGQPQRVPQTATISRTEANSRGRLWALAAVCILLSILVRISFRFDRSSPPAPSSQVNREQIPDEIYLPTAPLPVEPRRIAPPWESGQDDNTATEITTPRSASQNAQDILQRHREQMERIRQEHEARMQQIRERARSLREAPPGWRDPSSEPDGAASPGLPPISAPPPSPPLGPPPSERGG